jgi:phage terminase small subunit
MGAMKNVPPAPSYQQLLERLPAKQARFVEEYLIDLNPAKAAIRAHYSERAANRQGSRLLKQAGVRAAVEAVEAEISKRLRINQDEVIKELALIGFADLKDYVAWDETGRPVVNPSDNLVDGKSRVVESIKFETTANGPRVTIKLHDKVRALMGILDRVKPADPPPTQKHEVTFTSFPPEPGTMEELEMLVRGGKKETP